ncbi:MAG: aryl-sulfate sulfotransferase, partial [Acidobacteriota bacterium]|nr:aryl-sulfate sulfotransferase [Acidobacteriota bacterium]
ATFAVDGNLTLYDNGNTRVAADGGNSRGQEWRLDEKNLIATPVLNLDLGVYSFATGSSERLSNGNYVFYDGVIVGSHSKAVEYTPSGALQFEEDIPANIGYRSFRMRSLYSEY